MFRSHLMTIAIGVVAFSMALTEHGIELVLEAAPAFLTPHLRQNEASALFG